MKERTDSASQPGRKRYTEEFRRSVVDHWQNSGKTAAQVAQEFGVNLWNLRDWKRQYGTVARPVDGPAPRNQEELLQENRQLRKELARVTMQRDIFKKNGGDSFATVKARYAMMEALAKEYPLRDLCQILRVARSG